MKKVIYTLLMVLSFSAVYAQGEGKPMNNKYVFKDTISFDKALYIDTAVLDLTQGINIVVDSVGSSVSGYVRIITDDAVNVKTYNQSTLLSSKLADINFIGDGVVTTNVGDSIVVNIANDGEVKGTGAAQQIAIWSSGDSLLGSSSIRANPAQSKIILGTTATGDSGVVVLREAVIKANASRLSIETPAASDISIQPKGEEIINVDLDTVMITQQSNVAGTNFSVKNKAGSSSLFVTGTGFGSGSNEGFVGINTETPAGFLHIEADATAPSIRLNTPLEVSAGASTGTLGGNFPTAAAPAKYLVINIDGAFYYFPLWASP